MGDTGGVERPDRRHTGTFTVLRDPPTGGNAGQYLYYRFWITDNYLLETPPFASAGSKGLFGDVEPYTRADAYKAFNGGTVTIKGGGTSHDKALKDIQPDARFGHEVYTMSRTTDSKKHEWHLFGVYSWISKKGTKGKVPLLKFRIESYNTSDDCKAGTNRIEYPLNSPNYENCTLLVGGDGNLFVEIEPCDPANVGGVDTSGTIGGVGALQCLWGCGNFGDSHRSCGSPKQSAKDSGNWWIEARDSVFVSALSHTAEQAVAKGMVGQFNLNNIKTCGKSWPDNVQQCYKFVRVEEDGRDNFSKDDITVFGRDTHQKCQTWWKKRKCARLQDARATSCKTCGPRGGAELAQVGMKSLMAHGFGDAIRVLSLDQFSTQEADDNATAIAWEVITMEGYADEHLGVLPGNNAQSIAYNNKLEYKPRIEDSFIYQASLEYQLEIVRSMSWELYQKWRQEIRVTGKYDWNEEEYKSIIVEGTELEMSKLFLKKVYQTSIHMRVKAKINNNFSCGMSLSMQVPSFDEPDDPDKVERLSLNFSAWINYDDLFTHAFDEEGRMDKKNYAWDTVRVKFNFGNDLFGQTSGPMLARGRKAIENARTRGSRSNGGQGVRYPTIDDIKFQVSEELDSRGIAGNDKIWLENVAVQYHLHLPNGFTFKANLNISNTGVTINPGVSYEYAISDAVTFAADLEFDGTDGGTVGLGLTYNKEIFSIADPISRLWDPKTAQLAKTVLNAGVVWNESIGKKGSDKDGNTMEDKNWKDKLQPNMTIEQNFGELVEIEFDLMTGEGAIEFRKRLWDSRIKQVKAGQYQDPTGCKQFISTGDDCGDKSDYGACKGNAKDWSTKKWDHCTNHCGNCFKGYLEAYFRMRNDPRNTGVALWDGGMDFTFEKSLFDFGPVFGRVKLFATGQLRFTMGGGSSSQAIAQHGFRFEIRFQAGAQWKNRILEYLGFPFNLSFSPVIGFAYRLEFGAVSSYGTRQKGQGSAFAMDVGMGFAQIGIEWVDGARAELRRRHVSVFNFVPVIGGALASLPICSTLGSKETIEQYAYRVGTERAIRLFVGCADKWDAAYQKMRDNLRKMAKFPPDTKGAYKTYAATCEANGQKNVIKKDQPVVKGFQVTFPYKHECMCTSVLESVENAAGVKLKAGKFGSTAPGEEIELAKREQAKWMNNQQGYRWCRDVRDFREKRPFCIDVEKCYNKRRIAIDKSRYMNKFFPTHCDDQAPDDKSACEGNHMTLGLIFDIWSERETIVFNNLIRGQTDPDKMNGIYWAGKSLGQKLNIFKWIKDKGKKILAWFKKVLGYFKDNRDKVMHYCRGIDYSACGPEVDGSDTSYAKAYKDFILGGDNQTVIWDNTTEKKLDGFIGRRHLIGHPTKGTLPNGKTFPFPYSRGEYQKSLKGCLQGTTASNMPTDPDQPGYSAKQNWQFYTDINGCYEPFHRDIEKGKTLIAGGYSPMASNFKVCCCKDLEAGNDCCNVADITAACIADNTYGANLVNKFGCEEEGKAQCCALKATALTNKYHKLLRTIFEPNTPEWTDPVYCKMIWGDPNPRDEDPYLKGQIKLPCQKQTSGNLLSGSSARVPGGHSYYSWGESCYNKDNAALYSLAKNYNTARLNIMNNMARPEVRSPLFTNGADGPCAGGFGGCHANDEGRVPIKRWDGATDGGDPFSQGTPVPGVRTAGGGVTTRNVWDLSQIPNYPQGDENFYNNFGEILDDLYLVAGVTPSGAFQFFNQPRHFQKRYKALQDLRRKIGKTAGGGQTHSQNMVPIQAKALGMVNQTVKLLGKQFRNDVIDHWNMSLMPARLSNRGTTGGKSIYGEVGSVGRSKEANSILNFGYILAYDALKSDYGTRKTNIKLTDGSATFNVWPGYQLTTSAANPYGVKMTPKWYWHTKVGRGIGRSPFMYMMRVIQRRLGIHFFCNGNSRFCAGREGQKSFVPPSPKRSGWDDVVPNAELQTLIHEWHIAKWQDSIFARDCGILSGNTHRSEVNASGPALSKTYGCGGGSGKCGWYGFYTWEKDKNGKAQPWWNYCIKANVRANAGAPAGKIQSLTKDSFGEQTFSTNHIKHPQTKLTNYGEKGWTTGLGYKNFISFGVSLNFIINGDMDPQVNDYEMLKRLLMDPTDMGKGADGKTDVNLQKGLVKHKFDDRQKGYLACYWGRGGCSKAMYHGTNKWTSAGYKEPCWGSGFGRPLLDEDWGSTPSWKDYDDDTTAY